MFTSWFLVASLEPTTGNKFDKRRAISWIVEFYLDDPRRRSFTVTIGNKLQRTR